MQEREKIVHAWFDMWLTGHDTGIQEIFMPDAVYNREPGGRSIKGVLPSDTGSRSGIRAVKSLLGTFGNSSIRVTKRLWNGTSRMKWRPAKLKNLMVFLLFIGQKMGRYNR